MKRILISVFLLLSLQGNAQALKNQGEFGVGYGLGSIYRLAGEFASVWNDGSEVHSFGINAWYRYHITHAVSIGLSAGYEKVYTQGTFYDRMNCYTFAPELSWSYWDRNRNPAHGNLKVYGAFSMGLAYITEDHVYFSENTVDSHVIPMGQITPIGFRFGTNIAGFAEFGFGYKGMLNFGVTARFP